MAEEKFLNEYRGFVDSVTSDASKDLDVFVDRLKEIDETGVNVPRLLTGAVGICDEGGEFLGLVKKIYFHGKELTPELKEHLASELSDVMWYWANSCTALGIDPYDVVRKNIEKLEARYPGGFSTYLSDNRKEGDI